jgi:hypothetical protein
VCELTLGALGQVAEVDVGEVLVLLGVHSFDGKCDLLFIGGDSDGGWQSKAEQVLGADRGLFTGSASGSFHGAAILDLDVAQFLQFCYKGVLRASDF